MPRDPGSVTKDASSLNLNKSVFLKRYFLVLLSGMSISTKFTKSLSKSFDNLDEKKEFMHGCMYA